jgi:hypothetical protein
MAGFLAGGTAADYGRHLKLQASENVLAAGNDESSGSGAAGFLNQALSFRTGTFCEAFAFLPGMAVEEGGKAAGKER